MSSRPDLRLDWCSYEAAKYAVEKWHYIGRMPAGKNAYIGIWEKGRFAGAVIFGSGATPELSKPYGLAALQVAELERVALSKHDTPTSRIVSIALRLVHRAMPGLRLIVSFADSKEGHHGGIYQAGGWVYSGPSFGRYIVTNGKTEHPRTLGARYGVGGQSIPWLRAHVDPNAVQVAAPAKHRYLYPLDAEMRAQILLLAQPYPKRAGSIGSDASAIHVEEGGASPTPALQLSTKGILSASII